MISQSYIDYIYIFSVGEWLTALYFTFTLALAHYTVIVSFGVKK